MFPVLFQLGPITVHTYGVMAAVGFLSALWVIAKLSERSGLPPQKMVDFAFFLLITGFVGARLLFVITRWDYFQNHLLDIFKVWEGGLVFFGGLFTTIPWGVVYVRKKGWNPWTCMDVILPALTLAHGLGRIGCFAAGCCYGKRTESFFGVKFNSELVNIDLRGVPIHPTQLYEATSLALLFFGLLYIFKRKRFEGQVALSYLIIYPIVRSVIEIFRGDKIRGFVIDGLLSTSQFISILIVTGAAFALHHKLKALRPESNEVD